MAKKWTLLLIVQCLLVVLTGFFSGDTWMSCATSVIGIAFNFLVSIHRPIGFLFGFVYALANGFLSFQGEVYATFVFMIFLQAPMSIYSFLTWKKREKQGAASMKKMKWPWVLAMAAAMALCGAGVMAVLAKTGSPAAAPDAVFFVFSVTACLLLAFCYRNAYLVTLLSGLGGVILWTGQMIAGKPGLSVAAFYMIVAVNSIIAVYQQYCTRPAPLQEIRK